MLEQRCRSGVGCLSLQEEGWEVIQTSGEEQKSKEIVKEVVREGSRCKKGIECSWKPKCMFGHPEGGNFPPMGRKKSWRKQGEEDGEGRKSKERKRGGKDCRSGQSCRWKPLCLFLHPEGGNDHETAYRNFSAKKGNEQKEERARAKEKVMKKVEAKFDWEGGSSYSNMRAWCQVAERVNKEALDDVNGWLLDKFMDDQVSILLLSDFGLH